MCGRGRLRGSTVAGRGRGRGRRGKAFTTRLDQSDRARVEQSIEDRTQAVEVGTASSSERNY